MEAASAPPNVTPPAAVSTSRLPSVCTAPTLPLKKTLPVPELATEVQAAKGFNVIATANDRDRGVNDLSSALRRRFNTVVLPLPATEEEEATHTVAQLLVSHRKEHIATWPL